jgi:hypothetical protein
MLGAMRVRLRQSVLPLALPLAALALAACGGSSHSSTSAAAITQSRSTTVRVVTESSSSAPTSTTATTSTTTTATTTSTSTKDTNVRLPASFTIHAGGVLTPGTIAAPKHTDIQLSVTSADGKTHALTIAAPPHYYYLKVTPGSPARALLSELRDGHYTVTVDGAKRGLLIVGAVPGP